MSELSGSVASQRGSAAAASLPSPDADSLQSLPSAETALSDADALSSEKACGSSISRTSAWVIACSWSAFRNDGAFSQRTPRPYTAAWRTSTDGSAA